PEAADSVDGDIGDEGGFGCGRLWDDDLAVAGFGGCQYGGEYAAHRQDSAVEPQFADHHESGDFPWVDAFGRGQHGASDGEVESAAAFGYRGGAESDGEFLLRPFGSGVRSEEH